MFFSGEGFIDAGTYRFKGGIGTRGGGDFFYGSGAYTQGATINGSAFGIFGGIGQTGSVPAGFSDGYLYGGGPIDLSPPTLSPPFLGVELGVAAGAGVQVAIGFDVPGEGTPCPQ